MSVVERVSLAFLFFVHERGARLGPLLVSGDLSYPNVKKKIILSNNNLVMLIFHYSNVKISFPPPTEDTGCGGVSVNLIVFLNPSAKAFLYK